MTTQTFNNTAQHQRVRIFDTTLRDGEQSPGNSMTVDQKIQMAMQIEKLGVDIIEAGFPRASEGDWNAVNSICHHTQTVVIAGLSRATDEDIRQTASAISPAIDQGRGRIHTFIATSDIHIQHKLQMKPDEVINAIRHSVSFARSFTSDVEWSAEDASRSNRDFLVRAVKTAIEAGATTINLPDTVGYTTPHEYADMFSYVMNRVSPSSNIVFSAHCHNDLGRAVDNSLAAVQAGARQVECTVNGIGERAGNAALEQIAMNMAVRSDIYPYETGIVTQEITQTSEMLRAFTNAAVQSNWPIVGANAFAHESGIHQDGMLKNRETYEIMTPQSVGAVGTDFVIGKHSGKAAIKDRLEKMGFKNVSKDHLHAIYEGIMDRCDQHKTIDDNNIVSIAQRVINPQVGVVFSSLQITS